MTKRPWVLAIAGVVAVLAGLVIVADGRLPAIVFPTSPVPAACDIPGSVTADRSPAAVPAGGVVVADQGFSQTSQGAVSVGAIVRNADTRIAYDTQVTFRLFDQQQVAVGSQNPATARIPVLLPGQQVGVAADDFAAGPVGSIGATVGTTQWLPAGALGSFSAVGARYLRTLRYTVESGEYIDIHYSENSPNCRALRSDGTVAIFRDRLGAIVGGGIGDAGLTTTLPDGRRLETEPPTTPSCSPGERETWIFPQAGQPADADDSRTELYPYCALPEAPLT